MKARIIILTLLAIMMTACGEKGGNDDALDISGQWELIDIQTKSAQIGDAEIEIYIDFRKDNTFSLWQKLGQGRYEKFTGTWALGGTVLTGKYSDKKDWGASYDVSIDSGNLVMAEKKQNIQRYVYKKTVIPSDIQ